MEIHKPIEIEVEIQKPSMIKQVMESRSHPLDMVREAISNMSAPEVAASEIVIQHYSDPELGAAFRFRDNGCGMEYSEDEENPGRLNRFVGLGYSKAAGLTSDLYGWKGLGTKLMLNCRKLEVITWIGNTSSQVFELRVNEPRGYLLQDVPKMPKFYLTRREPDATDQKGTQITVYGYDGGQKEYSFPEIKQYLYLNTFVGLTKLREVLPKVRLKVGPLEEEIRVGFQWIKPQYESSTEKSWRTVVINPPICISEKAETGEEVTIVLKGGFTLDTGLFRLSPHKRNTGLRLSVKGIPYFQLDFYSYKGEKFQQYKDLCSFVVECDAIESKLNMDRSSISNQFGDDPIVKAFRKAVMKAFDHFSESPEYRTYTERRRREDEVSKAGFLIQRQKSLSSADQEFVCVQEISGDIRVLHRVPKNEQDTLALFWKLEGAGLLPFEKFSSLEHTGNQGIDVIATFQVSDVSQLRIMEPVEFEATYENFIRHMHNPKQTALIICWEVEKPKSLEQLNPYTYRTIINDSILTVFEIKNFPGLITKKSPEIY
ncbi:MAG: hypothetical protein WAV28_10820 [Sedimentisphaerales bacterium]